MVLPLVGWRIKEMNPGPCEIGSSRGGEGPRATCELPPPFTSYSPLTCAQLTADFATVNTGGLVPARISSLLKRKSGGPPSSYCFCGHPKGAWPSSGPFSEKKSVHFSHRRVTKLKKCSRELFFFFKIFVQTPKSYSFGQQRWISIEIGLSGPM